MNIEDLMLKKEEIPVLYEANFQLPIHPSLLNPGMRINPNLASKVFAQAAREWYEDLKAYVDTEDLSDDKKKWISKVFLSKKPEIRREFGHQVVCISWEDEFTTDDNGFARVMSISRNAGGTIYFNQGDFGCRTFVPLDGDSSGYIQFSREKTKEFGFEKRVLSEKREGMLTHVYNLHNVDHYPGALFLRNWGIFYLNEALKSVLK